MFPHVIGPLSDDFGSFGIGLDERLRGAVHEVKADLQRRTTIRLSRRSRVGFNCNHIPRWIAWVGPTSAALRIERAAQESSSWDCLGTGFAAAASKAAPIIFF